MAEPGEPKPLLGETPQADGAAPRSSARADDPTPDPDLDDLIGFTSASSLVGRERPVPPVAIVPGPEVDREPEPIMAPEPERIAEPRPAFEPVVVPDEPMFAPPPETAPIPGASPEPAPEPESDLFELRPRPAWEAPVERTRAPEVRAEVAAAPAWAMETPPPTPLRKTFGRGGGPTESPEGAMSLYTIYALILFAVPTLGVAAVIALFAITSRTPPTQPLAISHHVFQKRTLWISAMAAALGVVLIAVNLGVFVLFILAVWVVVRGAAGILALSANRPIARPTHWLI